jgi:cytochrome c-type biogenesis protein CcmF
VFGLNRRRYGGYLVHLGVVLMAVGVIGTRFYPFETETVLSPGESVEVQDYTLALEGLERGPGENPVTTRASLDVYRGSRYLQSLRPRLDEYSGFQQTVAVPAVRTGLREDLYLVLAGWSAGGERVTLKIFINPLASFLWLGGLVLLAGGAVAVWPEARTARLPAPEARRRKAVSAAALVAGLLVLALAAWAMWGGSQGTAASPNQTPQVGRPRVGRPRVGQPAPDVTVELLDGTRFSLSDRNDEVVVVNFWSPDCPQCREEMPDLQAVWDAYQADGVVLLGVSLPSLEDEVREMIEAYDVTYPVAVNAVAPVEYGITGVPETFVVGPDGNVASVHIGPVSATQLREELDVLLAQ